MISVIIPVYNVEQYLARCIESVLQQKKVEYEIILVDDGSTDNSPRICDEYSLKYNNISVIHKKNEGLGYARNSGMEYAKGEYFFFLDSDDWIPQDALCQLLGLIEKNGVDIVCFMIQRTYENDRYNVIQPEKREVIVNKNELLRRYLEGCELVSTTACSKFYKRKIFEEEKFSNVPIHEDAYSMHLFLDKANKALITNQIYYVQYVRKGSLTQSNFQEKNMLCIECGDRVKAFIKDNFPELLPYAYYFLAERYVYTLNLIIKSGKNRRNKKIFCGILKKLKRDYSEYANNKEKLGISIDRQIIGYVKYTYLFVLYKKIGTVIRDKIKG